MYRMREKGIKCKMRNQLHRIVKYGSILHHIIKYGSQLHYIIKYSSQLHRIIKYSSIPHLSQYYTLYVIVRGLRIWPPNAAKCCKNASKFFPNVRLYNKLYKLYKIYKVYYIPYVPYIPYVVKGFLRRTDVYLRRTIVPTRQFSLCSNSQNIIRVNLLGNYSTSYITMLLIIYSSFLYTQPINRTYRGISYKVPLYNYYHGYGREE